MKQTIHTLEKQLVSVANRLRMMNTGVLRMTARINRLEEKKWWRFWKA